MMSSLDSPVGSDSSLIELIVFRATPYSKSFLVSLNLKSLKWGEDEALLPGKIPLIILTPFILLLNCSTIWIIISLLGVICTYSDNMSSPPKFRSILTYTIIYWPRLSSWSQEFLWIQASFGICSPLSWSLNEWLSSKNSLLHLLTLWYAILRLRSSFLRPP